MNNKILVIAAIAAMSAILVSAAILNQEASAKCKKKQSQSIAQANVCGNGNLPLNVKCQNLASQVQGDGNAINVIGTQ